MSEGKSSKSHAPGAFERAVGVKETRKLKARRRPGRSIWFGFGLFGLIGWSVAIPALAGAALGAWIDKRHPGEHSWTLMLLVAGVALGCLTAWRWVAREQKDIREEMEDKDE